MKSFNYIIFIFLFFLSQTVFTQINKKYIDVIPEKEYSAGMLHKLFFGDHWRSLWSTPVEFPVLDLKTFSGGLTPTEKGGGQQTKSLRFVDNKGTIWKFRSITKDPSKVLPPDLRNTIADEILYDQISSANPYGALIANYLLDAVGVLNSKPYLYYLPEDENLGEFKDEFGKTAGFLEIHPDESENSNVSFNGAEKIVSTYKLYERLEKESDEKIDAAEYLKARLMDCLLGDWDRHNDQWRWARYTVDGKKIWRPIPRDRDQVFPKFDGLLPSLSTYYVLQFCNFDYDYPDVRKITWNGRYPDQKILPVLTKAKWDSVALFVQQNLTNDKIIEAVKMLPPEVYHFAKDEIENKLISRRDLLKDYSDKYFNFINNVIDVYCTNKDDYLLVNRLNNDSTEVSIYKKLKDTSPDLQKLFFNRVFNNSITDEIRIHLLDGDDETIVKGNTDNGPKIIVIGYDGADSFTDSSIVEGYFLDTAPISDAEDKTYFYDSGKKSKFIIGRSTIVDQSKWDEPDDELLKYEQTYKDRHSDWFTYPILNYNKDNGFYFGLNSQKYFYSFRSKPFNNWISITPSYATHSKSFNLSLEASSNSLIKNIQSVLKLDYTEMFLSKYFGYGNETYYNEEMIENDYNQLTQKLFRIEPSVNFSLFKNTNYSVGFSFQYFNTTLQTDSLLKDFPYGNYGLGEYWLFNINSKLEFDTRDNIYHTHIGYYLKMGADFFPGIFDADKSFLKGRFDLRMYYTLETFTDITLALRTSGEKVWGKYPFIYSSFLGGENNLRGYNRERFSGESSLFLQTEIRTLIAKVKLILPSNFGLNFFYDTGRVFSKLESEKIHNSYGFSIWLSYLNRLITLSFTTAFSVDEEYYYFSTKMGF